MSGLIFALLSSLFWGLNGVLLRKGFESSDVVSGTLTVVSVTYLVTLLAAIPELPAANIGLWNAAMLAAAGVISYTFGRLFTYSSVASIGSSRAFSGTSTRILFSALLGVAVLNENLGVELAVGSALMVVGLYVFSTEKISMSALALSVLGGFAYGLAALFIKLGMLSSPLVSAFVAANFGLAALSIFAAASGHFKLENNVYLLAAGLSLGLGNVSYYLALSITPLVVVIPLSNLYPLVAVALSYTLIQRLEKVKFRTFAGSLLTVAGATIIALHA